MKLLIFVPLVLVFISSSCKEGEEKETQEKDKKEVEGNIKTDKFEELAVNPCNFISEEMVVKNFDVKAEDLKKDTHLTDEISWINKCIYKWKKEDFDEITKRIQDEMFASMKSQSESAESTIKKSMEMEIPWASAGVTNIKIYEDKEKAVKRFEQSHSIPSQKAIQKLDQEFDKAAEEKNLSDQQKEFGGAVSGAVVSKVSFKEVDGIGDFAYWDYLGKKLDVLVGNVQFGVQVHTDKGEEHDIKKAKEIAKEIIQTF